MFTKQELETLSTIVNAKLEAVEQALMDKNYSSKEELASLEKEHSCLELLLLKL